MNRQIPTSAPSLVATLPAPGPELRYASAVTVCSDRLLIPIRTTNEAGPAAPTVAISGRDGTGLTMGSAVERADLFAVGGSPLPLPEGGFAQLILLHQDHDADAPFDNMAVREIVLAVFDAHGTLVSRRTIDAMRSGALEATLQYSAGSFVVQHFRGTVSETHCIAPEREAPLWTCDGLPALLDDGRALITEPGEILVRSLATGAVAWRRPRNGAATFGVPGPARAALVSLDGDGFTIEWISLDDGRTLGHTSRLDGLFMHATSAGSGCVVSALWRGRLLRHRIATDGSLAGSTEADDARLCAADDGFALTAASDELRGETIGASHEIVWRLPVPAIGSANVSVGEGTVVLQRPDRLQIFRGAVAR